MPSDQWNDAVHRTATDPVTLKGVSVLIVDDEDDARELLVAMLENFGATVRAAASAADALTLLEQRRMDTGCARFPMWGWPTPMASR